MADPTTPATKEGNRMEEKLQRRLLLIRIDWSRVHERSCLPFTTTSINCKKVQTNELDMFD
jgi:hypothetical protein